MTTARLQGLESDLGLTGIDTVLNVFMFGANFLWIIKIFSMMLSLRFYMHRTVRPKFLPTCYVSFTKHIDALKLNGL